MPAPGFIDTNILVYAFADTGDQRHVEALALVESLMDGQNAVLSVQVLKEFYSVVTAKIRRPLPRREALAVIKDLRHACRVVDDTLPQLDRALDLAATHNFSIWDASVIAAAEAAGCRELYTEDLAHGTLVGKIHITNPLLHPPGKRYPSH